MSIFERISSEKVRITWIWKQGWLLRIQVILTFSLLILSKMLNVIHPLILKEVINNVTEVQEAYWLVALYAIVRFSSEFCGYIKDVTFANVSATSEVFIAHTVFSHI